MDLLVEIPRLNQTQTEKLRRKFTQIQAIIADFERLAETLEVEIRTEEHCTRIHDPSQFAHSILGKATTQRHDNLMRSIAQLKIQLDAVKKALSESLAASEAADQLKSGDRMLERSEIAGDGESKQVDIKPFLDFTSYS